MSIVEKVREKYSDIALSGLSNSHQGVQSVAEAFGYSRNELESIPAEANMGLSCGNPTAFAHLKPGETVVDLGCGGGIDILLAAPKVAPGGKTIGIDMTVAMIDRARKNAAKMGVSNAEFLLASIDQLPLESETVDCVVSNCVINLVPEKEPVFSEIFRVLKPGGRVAVSDIALKEALPSELANNVAAYVGCIAGAISIKEYVRLLKEAGFHEVQVVDTGKDLNAYSKVENQAACCAPTNVTQAREITDEEWIASTQACCGVEVDSPTVHDGLIDLMSRYDVNQYAASVQVYAVKSK